MKDEAMKNHDNIYGITNEIIKRLHERNELQNIANIINNRDGSSPNTIGEAAVPGTTCDPQIPDGGQVFACAKGGNPPAYSCSFWANPPHSCPDGVVAYEDCGKGNKSFDCTASKHGCNKSDGTAADYYDCKSYTCDKDVTCAAIVDYICTTNFKCTGSTKFECTAGHYFACMNTNDCSDNFLCSGGTTAGCKNGGQTADQVVNCDPGNTNSLGYGCKTNAGYIFSCPPQVKFAALEKQYPPIDNTPGDFNCGIPGDLSQTTAFNCEDKFKCNAADEFHCQKHADFNCGKGKQDTDNFECANKDSASGKFNCYKTFNCYPANKVDCSPAEGTQPYTCPTGAIYTNDPEP